MQYRLRTILPIMNLVAFIVILMVFVDLKIVSNPAIICSKQDYDCYALSAFDNRNANICRKIPNNDEVYKKGRWYDELDTLNMDVRAKCLYDLAMLTNNKELCRELDSSTYDQESCMVDLLRKFQ